MVNPKHVVHGYLMDMNLTSRAALLERINPLRIPSLIPPEFLVRTIQATQEECHFPELNFRTVWIGHHCTGYCWAIPERMLSPVDRTEWDEKVIEDLKTIIGVSGEPRMYYLAKYPEPAFLGEMGSEEGNINAGGGDDNILEEIEGSEFDTAGGELDQVLVGTT